MSSDPLLPIPPRPFTHESHRPDRLRRTSIPNFERIFVAHWRRWNRERNVLARILDDSDFTRREAKVAVAVIQWLGTRVGQSFLNECQRHCRALDEEHRDRKFPTRSQYQTEQQNAPFKPKRSAVMKAQVEAARERLKRAAGLIR